MGNRKRGMALPSGMQQKHGAYYFLSRVEGKRKWTHLGRDYGVALQRYGELVGVKPEKTPTVGEAMANHLIIISHTLMPDTLAGYRQSARRLAPVFGHMALADVERAHIYRYQTQRGDVAANRDRAFLSAVYTHLINAGLFKGINPCHGLRYRNPENPRQRYLSDEEFEKLVAGLPRKLSLMARWSYLTGMRQSNMRTMKVSDASSAGVTYIPVKGRKGRPPKPVLLVWTDALRQIWKEAAGIRIGSVPLFPTANGSHYSRDSFQSIWQRWRKKIAIPDLRWHDIRRKTGSDSSSDAEATERLVHADGAITKLHYRAKPKQVRPLR
jgi:integrase